jgi:hypothetical protein
MTVCPFCKKAVVIPNGGPCPSCGKVDPRGAQKAPAAPSAAGDDWDDLEIQRGSAGTQPTPGSSYGGGGFGGLGDDDEAGPGLSLELDAPVRSQAPPAVSAPPRAGASGGYPAQGEPMPQPLPPRSGRPMSDPTLAHQQSTPNMAPPPSAPVVQQPQQPPPGQMAPGGPPDAAVMIARYPLPPSSWWQTPAYAMRVLYRQFELRQDIDALKKKRSPDVPLYERALRTHDGTKFLTGMAISVALFMVATTLFFLPVIKRFAFDN